LEPGTGWQIDAGTLHAPGSLVTYEPQVNSDVFGMFQSMVEGRVVP
jgi:mannose-6-phosphate isomerase class I